MPSSSACPVTLTRPPRGENLIAFESRLEITCWSRWGSPSISSRSVARRTSKSTILAFADGRMDSTANSTSDERSTTSFESTSFPAMTLEMSSRSLMSCASFSARRRAIPRTMKLDTSEIASNASAVGASVVPTVSTPFNSPWTTSGKNERWLFSPLDDCHGRRGDRLHARQCRLEIARFDRDGRADAAGHPRHVVFDAVESDERGTRIFADALEHRGAELFERFRLGERTTDVGGQLESQRTASLGAVEARRTHERSDARYEFGDAAKVIAAGSRRAAPPRALVRRSRGARAAASRPDRRQLPSLLPASHGGAPPTCVQCMSASAVAAALTW